MCEGRAFWFVPFHIRRRGWLTAILLGLFALGAAVLLLRPGWEDGAWQRIQRRGVMRVGLDPSFPPFEVDNGQGEIVGYDVGLARRLARRFGVDVRFVPVTFDALYDGLFAERYELVISALPYDPRMTQDVLYSEPYFDAGQRLVVRSDENEIEDVDDLAGVRLAVTWGSAGDVEARHLRRQLKGLTLEPLRTPQEALEAVAAGRAGAALVDAVSAYSFIGSEQRLKVVGRPVTAETYVIAVPVDSPRLRREVNQALRQMKREGYLEQLEERWLW